MITICAVEKDEEEEIIRNVTKEFFPESLFITARGGCETGQKISADHPEVVWLEATQDNYDMISSLENTVGINFVMVSDDIGKSVRCGTSESERLHLQTGNREGSI